MKIGRIEIKAQRKVTNSDLTSLAIEAESITEKLIAVAGAIRKQYELADDVTKPAAHAVVFARLGSEASDLAGVILTLMAGDERTKELTERLTP